MGFYSTFFCGILFILMFACELSPKLPERKQPILNEVKKANEPSLPVEPQDREVLLELEQILNELYLLAGNFTYPKPSIGVSDTLFRVASYDPLHNHINIERPALKVCQQFGLERKSALALLIGHELGHFLFAKRDHQTENAGFFCSGTQEQQADILGVFLAYLARNDRLDDLVPVFIEKIYDIYVHAQKSYSAGYEPLKRRKLIAENVKQKAAQLRLCFLTGNYLIAAGEYELALDCYSFIEPYYKAREIAINQGLCKLLLAKNISNDGYFYPFHFISETQLDGIKVTTTDSEKQQLIDEAIHFFKTAKRFKGGSDFAADIDILCASIVMRELTKANELSQNFLKKKLNAKQRIAVKLAQALAWINSEDEGNHSQGLKLLNEIAADASQPLFAEMAQFNLLKFEKKSPERKPLLIDHCDVDSEIESTLKNPFYSLENKFSLNTKMSIGSDTINNHIFVEFSSENGTELRIGYSSTPQSRLIEKKIKDVSHLVIGQHFALLNNRNPSCPAIYEIGQQMSSKRVTKTIWLHRF